MMDVSEYIDRSNVTYYRMKDIYPNTHDMDDIKKRIYGVHYSKLKFRIGDTVRIIDKGRTYSSYKIMAYVMGGHRLYGNYYHDKPNTLFAIEDIKIHSSNDDILCGLKLKSGKRPDELLIISIKGIELVESAYLLPEDIFNF